MFVELKNYEELVTKSVGKKVLLYCSAPWCSPCKVFGPTLSSCHEEFATSTPFDVLKVNVDNDSFGDFLKTHSVSSVPCVLVYDNGNVTNRSVGATSKSETLRFLNENFGA